VLSLDVPASVKAHEPFQMTGVVQATAPLTGSVRLERNGRVLVKGPFEFHAGPNLLPFRDLVDEPGLVAYRLTGRRTPWNLVSRLVTGLRVAEDGAHAHRTRGALDILASSSLSHASKEHR
jgi:hypothetical protein